MNTTPLQGLAAFLRAEASGVDAAFQSHKVLLTWAREVEAVEAPPAVVAGEDPDYLGLLAECRDKVYEVLPDFESNLQGQCLSSPETIPDLVEAVCTSLRAQLAAQPSQAPALVLLHELEWADQHFDRHGYSKPHCLSCENEKADGHQKDCKLSAVLNATPPTPEPLLLAVGPPLTNTGAGSAWRRDGGQS